MKLTLTLILFLSFLVGFGQSIFNWTPTYELKLTDFQSPQTEISKDLTSYSIFSGTTMNFSFHMSSYEFMFTKNFNSKVKTTFNKKSAVIIAPDSIIAAQLVKVGQYNFDLAELYSRKFRKELYEQKGAFSNVNFFQPIYDKLQEEMNAVSARVMKDTNLGNKEDILKQEQDKILLEIESLSQFCLEYKPPKKKRK